MLHTRLLIKPTMSITAFIFLPAVSSAILCAYCGLFYVHVFTNHEPCLGHPGPNRLVNC